MPVSFNGLTSGIDTQAIIRATIEAQRGPIRALETRKGSYTSQISSLGKLTSKLAEFKTLAKDLAKTSNVLSFTIGVGDDKVIAATAEGESTAGRYELDITRLARAEKNRSIGLESDLSQVKAGTLTIGTAGDTDSPYTVTIEQGDTLDDVVDRINATGAKVDASIIRDGTKSYLQIVAAESGHEIGGAADDAVTITESYSGVDGNELGLVQVAQAQNALLTVDGLASESRTNKPSDIIPGIAVEFKKIGTSTLMVDPDKTGTKDKLKAFVDKANEVMDLVKAQTRTSEGARTQEPDPAVERLGTEIRSLINRSIEGLNGGYGSLSRIGIETNAAGKLEIDTKLLDTALGKDIRGIGRLFTKAETGISARLETLLERYTNSIDGLLGTRKKTLNGRIERLDTQIGRMGTRLENLGVTLQRQFTAMEQALSTYQIQGQALGTISR